MDTSTFYAVTAAACLTLVGLWWTVVQSRPAWLENEATRRLAGGVYASFLIPAVMSLGAQVGGGSPLVWQAVFVLAAAAGIHASGRLVRLRRETAPNGVLSRNSWLVPVLYGLVLFFALFPGFARWIGLTPLQLEALLVSGLVLSAHVLAWEFMTS